MRREWLIKKRKEKGYTLEEVAKAIGISVSMVSAIELGRRDPSGKVALRLAEFFQVDMTNFFEDKKSA